MVPCVNFHKLSKFLSLTVKKVLPGGGDATLAPP